MKKKDILGILIAELGNIVLTIALIRNYMLYGVVI